jgi:hypothetical protein
LAKRDREVTANVVGGNPRVWDLEECSLKMGGVQWLTSIIPAVGEVEIERILV